MTALKEFERLESTGLWRETPESQRREVLVSFGEATLALSDRNENALSHWSLAAVRRLNPGQRPAIFAPDGEASETLEISDDTMVAAIEKVRKAIDRGGAHPGRLRRFAMLASLALLAALTVFWLPGALIRHTVNVVPDVTRAEIGTGLRDRISRLTGEPCGTISGERALNKMRLRIAPDLRQLVVVRNGVRESVQLPGGLVLLNRALVEDFEEPDVVAGFVVVERLRGSRYDPLHRMLESAGLWASVRLLTSGHVPASALDKYAESLLISPSETLPNEALLSAFEAANLSSTPYAYAIDVSGETTLGLIEADPFRAERPPAVLSDGDWVSLQEICTNT